MLRPLPSLDVGADMGTPNRANRRFSRSFSSFGSTAVVEDSLALLMPVEGVEGGGAGLTVGASLELLLVLGTVREAFGPVGKAFGPVGMLLLVGAAEAGLTAAAGSHSGGNLTTTGLDSSLRSACEDRRCGDLDRVRLLLLEGLRSGDLVRRRLVVVLLLLL